MKNVHAKLVVSLFFCLTCYLPFSFSQSTANNMVRPYSEIFQYGSNMAGNSNGWTDTSIASIISKAGGHTLRPTLPETFVDKWGYPIRLNEFKYYTNNLGIKEITCFIQSPSTAHVDKTIFPGCTQSSKLFANLYQPIWNTDGTVNTNNYYANYVYKLLQTYGPYVRFWEVVNEPDYTTANPDNWLTRAPYPSESLNTQAPIYYYIRTLRITWEVVKKFRPDAYVTTGGIGYSQYLDAILRYTDNPSDGSVSTSYPNKGGAYFDVLSYHCYPAFTLRVWDNSIGGFKNTRNSDFAATKIIDAKNSMQNGLTKYGYDGATYPKKHFIITETNISRRTKEWRYGSDTMQRNFGMKALVLAQKNNIKQLYFYGVGESINAPSQTTVVTGGDDYKLMGLYENLLRDVPGSEKLTQLGKGQKTLSGFLYGFVYDSVRTKALSLPANVEGGAFAKNGQYVYVLWAKNPLDQSETFSATYSFPSTLNISNLLRSEWDYSTSGTTTKQGPLNINLTASPSFFRPETTVVVTPATTTTITTTTTTATATALKSQTITFIPTPDKVYTSPAFNLQASSSSGLPVSFKKISGSVTIAGSTVTITSIGTVIIEASQAGNTSYSAAKAIRDTFVIAKAPQTINFSAITNKIYGSAPFALQATASSNLTVSYTVISGPASVSGNTVTLKGTGKITIRATQGGNSYYLGATPVSQSFSVLSSATTARSSATSAAVAQPLIIAPSEIKLQTNPNPFTSDATVQFQVVETGKTSVNITDLQGKVLGTLFNGIAQAGVINKARISSEGLTPGMYFIRLITGTKFVSQKIILLK